MQAKVLLLAGDNAGEKNAACAERLLSDISASFGHRLAIIRGKIGAQAKVICGEILPDETVRKCTDCQAVFCGSAQIDGLNELYDALNVPLVLRSFCLPGAATGQNALKMYLAQALSLDAESLTKAFNAVSDFASASELPLHAVPPNGRTKALWDSILSLRSALPAMLDAPEAVRRIISAPQSLGVLLVPPYAGSILSAAAETVFPCTDFIYDYAPESVPVFAPLISGIKPNVPGCVSAVSAMLRHALSLPGEAAILDAALENVLASGQAHMPDEMLEKICEQMSIAGEMTGLKNHG